MSSLYFSLSNQIDQNKFVQQVQALIFKQKDLKDKILKIEIVTINQETNELIPRLEYKNE